MTFSEPDFRRRRRVAAALAVGLLLLDLATKLLIEAKLPRGEEIPVIPGFFRIVHVLNDGAAWNIMSGRGGFLAVLATAVLVGGVIFYRRLTVPYWERHLAVGAMLAGVAGNLVDRLRLGGRVLDFISFHWREVWEYPSFNVADSAICVGVAIYILSSFIRPEPRDAEPSAAKKKAGGQA